MSKNERPELNTNQIWETRSGKRCMIVALYDEVTAVARELLADNTLGREVVVKASQLTKFMGLRRGRTPNHTSEAYTAAGNVVIEGGKPAKEFRL